MTGVLARDNTRSWEGYFSEGAVWPISCASLAALIDIGLSSTQIAAYFAVESDDVLALRHQHGLFADHSECLFEKSKDGDSIDGQAVADLLHELYNGLTAAKRHLIVVQRNKPEHPAFQDGVGKAAAQVMRTVGAYLRLRACLALILPPDHEPHSRKSEAVIDVLEKDGKFEIIAELAEIALE